MSTQITSAIGTIAVFSSHSEIAEGFMTFMGYSLRQWSFLTDPEDIKACPRGTSVFIIGDAGTIYNLQAIKDLCKEGFHNLFYITQ